jgi:hypothetical protein
MASTQWLALVRAEYREMPGMRLTKQQIQRLWGMDDMTCDTVVMALETEKFLKRLSDTYVLHDAN